ncbi:immunity 22 family protein [Acinetobacter sp. ABJ_C5_2]|uniref:immunity 22 family protein n=1 Tax=Acinetobacter sp. ABJ_C5_2 TaxID=3376992 RepID=UPI0037C7750E
MSFKTKIHLWLGLTEINEQEYWCYFDDSKELPKFCKEVGLDWLDQDFMGYYFDKELDDLKFIIEETPDPDHHEKIIKDCLKKGINKANAMFYYWGGDPIKVSRDKKYNTLTYIGEYEWS